MASPKRQERNTKAWKKKKKNPPKSKPKINAKELEKQLLTRGILALDEFTKQLNSTQLTRINNEFKNTHNKELRQAVIEAHTLWLSLNGLQQEELLKAFDDGSTDLWKTILSIT